MGMKQLNGVVEGAGEDAYLGGFINRWRGYLRPPAAERHGGDAGQIKWSQVSWNCRAGKAAEDEVAAAASKMESIYRILE